MRSNLHPDFRVCHHLYVGPHSAKHVEIVTVGNEILLGDVLDSNSNWICNQITGLGGQVERVVIVHDEVEAIVGEIEPALARNASLVFTLGGLGPTADDLTLGAVARAVHAPLELNQEALSLVQARYEHFQKQGSVDSAELTESRRKMAILPQGALPLINNIGAAPGVLLRLPTGQIIVSLPGVPGELKDIFANSLGPTLRELFGNAAYVERPLVTDCKDESVLSPILRRVSQKFEDVYIKSRAKRFGRDVRFRVTLSARGKTRDEIAGRLDEVQRVLEASLGEEGIHILESNGT